MAKLPWCGKENKPSHEVFVATKPGEMVSVDQMALTKARFFAQLKGALTKKRYKCATIFVDHYSRLRFVHLQINNLQSRPLPPNVLLRPLPPSTAFPPNIIIATTAISMITLFDKPVTIAVNVSPSVASMPIFKMGLLSVPLGTSARVLASNCCTRAPVGQRQYTLPYGPMLYTTRPSCTI
jgi:hypothetical protein